MPVNLFNEMHIIAVLIVAITVLFDRLIARAAWSATIYNNPDRYGECIEFLNFLDMLKGLITSDKLRWKHG